METPIKRTHTGRWTKGSTGNPTGGSAAARARQAMLAEVTEGAYENVPDLQQRRRLQREDKLHRLAMSGSVSAARELRESRPDPDASPCQIHIWVPSSAPLNSQKEGDRIPEANPAFEAEHPEMCAKEKPVPTPEQCAALFALPLLVQSKCVALLPSEWPVFAAGYNAHA